MAASVEEIRGYAVSQLTGALSSAKLTVSEDSGGAVTLEIQDTALENALSGTVLGHAFAVGSAMNKVAKHFPDNKFYLSLKISKFKNEETYLEMGGPLNQ
jgi:basic membrane lipoprotein Med (substrate-binding protein (PBP1-ABC) superfamily)